MDMEATLLTVAKDLFLARKKDESLFYPASVKLEAKDNYLADRFIAFHKRLRSGLED